MGVLGSATYSPRVERDRLFVPSLGIELQDQLMGVQQSDSLYLKTVPVVISQPFYNMLTVELLHFSLGFYIPYRILSKPALNKQYEECFLFDISID